MREMIHSFDFSIIQFVRKANLPFARLAIFIVFFWFGILKVFLESPANPLVNSLLEKTLPFISFGTFIYVLGFYEMAIGIAFLIPKFERVAIGLLVPHLVVTSMPLFLLSSLTWQGFLLPTLEGQYIIKNLLIVGLALGIASRLRPLNADDCRCVCGAEELQKLQNK